MTAALLVMALYHYHTAPYLPTAISPLNKDDAIIALAFGQGKSQTPGDSNRGLAAIIDDLYQQSDTKPTVLAQWEIADVLKKQYQIKAHYRATIDKDGHYLSTYGVLKQFKDYLKHHPLNGRYIIVAQTDHAFRVSILMQQLGFNRPIHFGPIQPSLGWSAFDCDTYGYSPRSTQPWTRARHDFLKHELHELQHLSLRTPRARV